MKEFKEVKIPLSFYYWIGERIFKQTFRGYINREQVVVTLRQHFNIPKRMCPIIIKELEILGTLKEEDGFIKVKETKTEDEIIKGLERELGLSP